MKGTRHTWADVRRILCVRLDNLGDVLMATPAIAALKHGLPGSDGEPCERHVTLWASENGAAIGERVPEVDACIAYDAPWVAAGRDRALDERAITRLAVQRFDAAVIFTTYSQSALPAATICALAGIPLCLAHVRENPYGLVSHWVRESEPFDETRHEVERQLALVASIGARPASATPALSLAVDVAARERARGLRARHGFVDDARLVVLHPGASAPSRRWPADRFAALAARLAVDGGFDVMVTGSMDERVLTKDVASGAIACDARAASRVHDFGGAFALSELIGTIADAALLVSNNSGPVHIAAACATPVVDLYALTNPQHTPWQVASRVLSHDVPCRNCYRSICPELHHGCLEGVSVDEAYAATMALATGRDVVDEDPDPRRAIPIAPLRRAEPAVVTIAC